VQVGSARINIHQSKLRGSTPAIQVYCIERLLEIRELKLGGGEHGLKGSEKDMKPTQLKGHEKRKHDTKTSKSVIKTCDKTVARFSIV